MSRIAIIDCGSGNLYAVQHALERIAAGSHVFQCFDANELERADKVILTGSGKLDAYIDELHRLLFVDALREFASSHQVLASNIGMLAVGTTVTATGKPGLGLLSGVPRSFNSAVPRIPHIGWNNVTFRNEHWLFSGMAPGLTGYFAHGKYLHPGDTDTVVAETEHGETFASVITRGNCTGLQFLPENSGEPGLRVLANFAYQET